MDELPAATVVALAGGAGGLALGLAARLGRFCTLAAIEDSLYGGDRRRLRMWALAMAVAIVGVGLTGGLGLVDYSNSVYHQLPINVAAWTIGGLLFGVGMAFCGTCAFGTLIRMGGGDLRAFCDFLVLGISAYMAVAGPTALLRQAVLDPLAAPASFGASRSLIDLAGGRTSGYATLVALAVAMLLAGWCLTSRRFRTSRANLSWGVFVGLVIAFGWLMTGWYAADSFEPKPARSFTFSLPLGQVLIYLMTMSGSVITFSIGSTLGVIVGSFIGSLIRREFRWEAADDAREMRRHVVGAFLMGTGGVYAGGCTVGQGLSAVSILAYSAPVVLASIWLGAWLGLTHLMEGSVIGTLRSLLGATQRT